jgi:hypothetical protein
MGRCVTSVASLAQTASQPALIIKGKSSAIRGAIAQEALDRSSTATGKMRNLNNLIPTNSNYELVGSLAINDAGQILVNGSTKPQRESRAFLLTPVSAR